MTYVQTYIVLVNIVLAVLGIGYLTSRLEVWSLRDKIERMNRERQERQIAEAHDRAARTLWQG